MDTTKQRIAIAEACGWTFITQGDHPYGLPPNDKTALRESVLPDYLNDLNSMHEAYNMVIKPLSGLTSKFGEVLQDVLRWYCVGVAPDYRRDLISLSLLANASAAQRAEAFLKTLSLWVENANHEPQALT